MKTKMNKTNTRQLLLKYKRHTGISKDRITSEQGCTRW